VRPADSDQNDRAPTTRPDVRADGGSSDPDNSPLADVARLVYYLVKSYDALRDLRKFARRGHDALERLLRLLR
jgi:hypothetical protein